MSSSKINYIAVFVAALAVFVAGFLWYSPILFGNLWLKAHGYTPEQLETMRAFAGRAYTVSFACYLVMGTVLTLLIAKTGATTAVTGLKLGALTWLGFAATIGLTANMFSSQPFSLYLIDAGYQLVYLMVMGAILGGWRKKAVEVPSTKTVPVGAA
ncbi:MAG: DUF1761 domain-containing protein [bacterium]